MKSKILVFNGYYIPSKNCGGPVTSIQNAVNACFDEYDFYIVCYNHDFGDKTRYENIGDGWNKVGNAYVQYVPDGFYDFNYKNIFNLLSEIKPDVIWFSGVLTPNNKLVTMRASRKLKIPVIFSPRGEVSADRVCIKGYKKRPYLFLLKLFAVYRDAYFHVTSDDEKEGVIKFFNPKKDHIFFSSNIPYISNDRDDFREKVDGELKLIFFSRIHEVKNLKFAISILKNVKENIIFDIYGPIESKEYWQECTNLINTMPENIKINYKGIIDKENLSATIKIYHCFLFPTINENYGHVIAESLANNCPVILSKGTTPWDDLDKKAGYVCDLEKETDFVNAVEKLANMNENQYNELLSTTQQYYIDKTDSDDAINLHIKMFRTIINNN